MINTQYPHGKKVYTSGELSFSFGQMYIERLANRKI